MQPNEAIQTNSENEGNSKDKTKFHINPMGGRLPVKNIELVDREQEIWRGTMVDFPDMTIDDPIVYFSRKYDRVNSDLDRCLEEIKMPADIMGETFWLIPKEKFLCSLLPERTSGGIMIPTPKGIRRRLGRPQ